MSHRRQRRPQRLPAFLAAVEEHRPARRKLLAFRRDKPARHLLRRTHRQFDSVNIRVSNCDLLAADRTLPVSAKSIDRQLIVARQDFADIEGPWRALNHHIHSPFPG
jgi:hypothetical protein